MRAASALARPMTLPPAISVNGCAAALATLAAVRPNVTSTSGRRRGEMNRIPGIGTVDLQRDGLGALTKVNRRAGRHRGNDLRKIDQSPYEPRHAPCRKQCREPD